MSAVVAHTEGQAQSQTMSQVCPAAAEPVAVAAAGPSPMSENPAQSHNGESTPQGSNPVVELVDLESAVEGNKMNIEGRQLVEEPCKRGLFSRRSLLLAMSLVLAGLGVCAAILLYPRDPTWRITKLDLDPSKFSMLIMGQGNYSEPLGLTAHVEFSNPNLIGTTTEPGKFEVFYGGRVMSWGTADSVTVGPKSTKSMSVDILVQFDEAMAHDIVTEVTTHDMNMKVSADVNVVAKVGLLRIKTHVHCDITALTTMVFTKPEDVLTEKDCTYSYSL